MLPEQTMQNSARPLSFARRAEPDELPELMDQPCTYEEFRDCLRDLSAVNRLTRGYAPTLAFLDRVVSRTRRSERPLRILDVGSGGGDTLRTIAEWAEARNILVELTGVDLNPYAAPAAEELGAKNMSARKITFMTGDVFTYAPDKQPDVILSALFTHHLGSPEIVRFLRWMDERARVGWFINDLRRSARAAFWFRFLPIIFRWHRFVRHDGPVSLQRAFTPADWQRYLAEAHISGAVIESHAMNRLCVARIREIA